MDPDEVIEALTEAVSAVQANVQVFETSCTETGDQALVIQGQYNEKTQQLMEELNNLSEDSEALVNEIMESAIGTTEEVNNEVSSSINEYLSDLEEQIETGLEALTDTYTSAQETTVSFIDETSSQVDDIAGSYKDVGSTYRESLNNSIEKLEEVETAVQEQLSTFIETVSQQIQTGHDDMMQQYNDFVDSTVNSDLSNAFEEHDGEFEEFSDNLLESLEDMGGMVSDKFEELSMELIEYADDKATEEVKDTINGMIDQIVEELASIISESIIKSSVGVSVTGATSPYMPMLIAFNKIFDALEFAIDAFKKFRDAFG